MDDVFCAGRGAGERIIALHHCIAIGDGATCTQSYEFALRGHFADDNPQKLAQVSTIMTPEEHAVIAGVLRRAFTHRGN